jgi:prepilin-type N-terminal cleavage/methylation domain-containing protein
MRPRRTSPPLRPGFSLIEMLVAITIMVVVIASIVAFLGTTGSAAREAATRATIQKLDALLQARYRQMLDSFTEQERKATMKNDWTNINYAATNYLTGPQPAAAKRAFVKLNRYRGAFPSRLDDMNTLGGSDVNPNRSLWPATTPAGHRWNTESSELLYLILAKGGGTGSEAQIADSINPRHIKDTDGDGLMEFVDDWGNPLRFYNTPTRLVRPGGRPSPSYSSAMTAEQQSLAKALIASLPPVSANAFDFRSLYNQDPLDPRGALRFKEPFTAPINNGDRHFYANAVTFEEDYYTPDTFFAPLIVSCGQDETLGLGEPVPDPAASPPPPGYYRHAFPVSPEEAADNITNLQSVGGRP